MFFSAAAKTFANFVIYYLSSGSYVLRQFINAAVFLSVYVFRYKRKLESSDTVFNNNHVIMLQIEQKEYNKEQRYKNYEKKQYADCLRKHEYIIFINPCYVSILRRCMCKQYPCAVIVAGNFFYIINCRLFR